MWTEDFILRALLGGVAAALVAGPLGCFVVWRRMAYFGDALAHSALLGVALGFLLGLDLRLGTLAVCLALALLLILLQRPGGLASDTALGILAHTALSAGLVAVSLMERLRADLMGYLFGDILAVTPGDLGWIWGGGALALALLLILLQRPGGLASDTALGILAHTALSAGLVAVSLMERLRADLMGYLFGDILAVTPGDLGWIWGGGALALALLGWLWRDLLALTVHEELAQAEGVPAWRVRLAFMGLIALVVAIAMKIVGVLLITSLLIIPPAAARRFARTPEQMAFLAALLGCAAVAGGLAASLRWDTPAGPSVVLAAAALFALSALAPLGRGRG
ncbi:MAG: hypothetical protein A3I72_11585 [Candidatus Tectomicrobia bacterium RIFCSPLOWO2_02_FULL_70_19]|nr:MAG: hypothetical protein A3I72_11585 [Candidatus Tectomicrobia bacterium RIFCSPLOWO2_02_FULL_70_19]